MPEDLQGGKWGFPTLRPASQKSLCPGGKKEQGTSFQHQRQSRRGTECSNRDCNSCQPEPCNILKAFTFLGRYLFIIILNAIVSHQMNDSPEILCEAEILQDTLNTIDSSSGSKKGKSNPYDWEEFTLREEERNAPERRLIELGGKLSI